MTAPRNAPAPEPERPVLTSEEVRRLARRIAVGRLANEAREERGEDPRPLPLEGRLPPGAALDDAPLDEIALEAPGIPPAFAATLVREEKVEVPPPEGAPEGTKPEVRTRLRLALWRHETTIDTELLAATGELFAWRNPKAGKEIGTKSIGYREAEDIARRAVDLPADAGSPFVDRRSLTEPATYEVSWVHLVGPDGDVVVEGDKILVRVNETTGRVHTVFRRWRQVGPTPPEDGPAPEAETAVSGSEAPVPEETPASEAETPAPDAEAPAPEAEAPAEVPAPEAAEA